MSSSLEALEDYVHFETHPRCWTLWEHSLPFLLVVGRSHFQLPETTLRPCLVFLISLPFLFTTWPLASLSVFLFGDRVLIRSSVLALDSQVSYLSPPQALRGQVCGRTPDALVCLFTPSGEALFNLRLIN